MDLKKYPGLYKYFKSVTRSNKVLFYSFFKMKNNFYAIALSRRCKDGMLSILIDETSLLNTLPYTLNEQYLIIFTDKKQKILFSNKYRTLLSGKTLFKTFNFNKKNLYLKDIGSLYFLNFDFLPLRRFKGYIWIFKLEDDANFLNFYNNLILKLALSLFFIFLSHLLFVNYNYVNFLEENKKLKEDYENVLLYMPVGIVLLDKQFQILFKNDKTDGYIKDFLVSDYFKEIKANLVKDKYYFREKVNLAKLYLDIFAYYMQNFNFIMFIDKTKEVKRSIEKDDIISKKNRKVLNLNKNMQEVINSKLEFLSSISHDLRNPLNAIINSVKLLTKSCKDKELMDILLLNSQKLLNYTNYIIEYSKLEKNLYSINLSYVNLKDLLSSVVKAFNPYAINKKINIYLDLPDNLPLIETDKDKLLHILDNLLSNAIKYTDKGFVRLSVKVIKKEGIEIIIEDTGKGISEESFEKIYSPFFQEDAKKEGFGLGLTIVKKYVDVLGGNLEISNKKNTKGVIVKLFLPF